MRIGRRTGVVAWWLTLATGVFVLHAAAGPLPAPPLTALSDWTAWMAGRDPVVVAFGLARLLALGAAWYGVAVTVGGVLLRLGNVLTLVAIVDRLTVLPLRRLVAATVTVGLSAGPLGTTAGAAGPGVTATVPGSVPTTTVVASPPHPDAGSSATVTMHRLEPTAPAPGAPAPSAGPEVEAPLPPPPGPGAGPITTWTVRPGQCFWSIADAELGRVWGRRPTAAEIVPYWSLLIDTNRGELADPHNPDLIFPGQEFTLPPP